MNIPLPKPIVYATLILVILAMIPPALIARSRAVNSELPRIALMQDMASQHRLNAQQASPLFRDGRAMRPKVEGTIARGDLRDDPHYYDGVVGDDWAIDFPAQVRVDRALLERGRERYDIFCAVCHGTAGFGDGMVHRRAQELMETGAAGTSWVPPTSLHDEEIREQPVGQIYNAIANGVRNMPAYNTMIPTDDRWAIVAYVRALQRSQHAQPGDVAHGSEVVEEFMSDLADGRTEVDR